VTRPHFPRVAAALCCCALAAPPAAAQSAYEQLQTFSSLLSQIRLNYVDSVSTGHLVRGAIVGMLGSLDPHSRFQASSERLQLDAWLAGHLAGAGIIVESVDGAVAVQSVLTGTPAARAGVSPGDRLVGLNDTAVAGMRLDQVQSRLVGERGTRLRLLLERGARTEPETVSVRLRFELVRPRAVTVARQLAPGTGYVRLEQFLPEAAREVRDAVGRTVRGGPHRRLILDLRGNPGGAVIAAVEIAQQFLPERTLVFKSWGRRRDTHQEFRTERNGDFRDVELIVLIDERSASASEALAGSLQDHDRALIAGRRSFGKALMQQAFLVPPNDDIVWLTVGWILSPSGRLIQRRYRGLSLEQYRTAAGTPGAPGDTAEVFRTAAGRIVRAGGGIAPDTVLAPPPVLPAWFVAAADSNLDHAVADSVAATVAGDARTRDAWMSDVARWQSQLVAPFLARVRRSLGVRAEPDSALAARLGRILAARVAEVRWGADALEEFRLRNDPDIAAALPLFPRLPALLRPQPPTGNRP
jgi:carboxyl-terminal processing protease